MSRDLSGKQLKVAPDDRTLPLCWRGAKPFKSIGEARKYFKPLTMAFSQGKRALLTIPPENYLILTAELRLPFSLSPSAPDLNQSEAQP